MPVLFKNPLPFHYQGEQTPPSIFRRIADAAEALVLIFDGIKFLAILANEAEE